MTRSPSRLYRLLAAFGLLASPIIAAAALQPFAGSGSEPAPPWRVVGLPRQAEPVTGFSIVWDSKLPRDTELVSTYTGRLRYLVLRGAGDPLQRWAQERRDIAADFLRLFGADTNRLPPLVGVAVGADADNTRLHSLGHLADLRFEP